MRLSLCLCFGSADFKNRWFFHFFFFSFFYSKKHDTVTINNHAFYTADACFRGQGKKNKSQPKWRNWDATGPFSMLVIVQYCTSWGRLGRVSVFVFFLENIRSSHQWCTLVIRWLFIKNQTQLFTSKGDGVCILPAYELPFFSPHCEQGLLHINSMLQCNTLLCW